MLQLLEFIQDSLDPFIFSSVQPFTDFFRFLKSSAGFPELSFSPQGPGFMLPVHRIGMVLPFLPLDILGRPVIDLGRSMIFSFLIKDPPQAVQSQRNPGISEVPAEVKLCQGM